jgi:cytochrome c oxidase subunit 1
MAYAILAIAVIGFLVWGHHMFVSGQSIYAGIVFSMLSFLVAVPSAIKVFNWTATLWRGPHHLRGADALRARLRRSVHDWRDDRSLSRVARARRASDRHVFRHRPLPLHHGRRQRRGVSRRLHFWWPKITGRLYSDRWARFAAILLFAGFNFTFFPQYLLGIAGMPRRYHEYPPEFHTLNVLSSAGAGILAAGYLLPMLYLGWSLVRGARANANPWRATGLEWRTTSPPPKHNFPAVPVVSRPPYAYPAGKLMRNAPERAGATKKP